MPDLPEFNELKIESVDAGTPPPAATDDSGAPDRVSSLVPPVSEAPPKSLRETILAAKAEVDASRAATNGDGRARDASGKFVQKADAGAVALPAAKESPPVQPDAQRAPATASAPSGTPPPGWSSESKAEWAKLPAHVINDIAKREKEVSDGFASYSQRQKELDSVVSTRRQHYASEGLSDTQAIDRLWTWFEALQNNPNESFPALARTFGYDLNVNPASGDNRQVPQNDPTQRLNGELTGLKSQVGQLSAFLAQQENARVAQEIAQFAKDRPHFEKAKPTMGRLMQAGMAGNLSEAYDKAIRMDPEIWASVQAEEKAKADAEAAKAALTRTVPRTAPQRAAVSARGGAPNGVARTNGPAAGESLRDTLRRNFAEARG